MLLSHPFWLSRWLAPVWEDRAFWAMSRQIPVWQRMASEETRRESGRDVSCDNGVSGNSWLEGHFAGRPLIGRKGRGAKGVDSFSAGDESLRSKRARIVTAGEGDTVQGDGDTAGLAGCGEQKLRQMCRGGRADSGQGELTLLGSPGGVSPRVLGGKGGISLSLDSERVYGLEFEPNGSLAGNMVRASRGILALALCWHDDPLRLLQVWAERVRVLHIIDWAMPERNLDYLCHLVPRALALVSGQKANRHFREFMRFGAEGVVERFNASQNKVFLRRLHHKKYRWGSILAVTYAVERLEAGGKDCSTGKPGAHMEKEDKVFGRGSPLV